VFVSHSEGDLKKYCKRGIFLDAGTLVTDGTVQEALDSYKTAEKRDADARAEKKKAAEEAAKKAAEAANPAPALVPGAVEAAR
jgi:ABC-2 type transport system ATP-binding protein